jgi:hypothetical protein
MKLPEIIEKRFEEYKKDVLEFIEVNDPYYGTYIIRPVIFISFDYYYDGMDKEEFRKIQRLMMDANTDFRNILYSWTIKDIKSKVETYVVYAIDKNDNKYWLKNNKDCEYLKVVNKGRDSEYKGGMPLSTNIDSLLQDYWKKYPFTKIK